jgi:CHAT domain-containing protein
MSHEAKGQDLITAFMTALDLKNLNDCEVILSQLRRFSHEQPAYAPWCSYFGGILANERDHDWAEAEQIFSRMLLTDLSPELRGKVLLALGLSYDYQGRWQEAIQTYENSLPVFAERGQFTDQAQIWNNMALSFYGGFTQGDFGPEALQKATSYCQSALTVLESLNSSSADVTWLKGSIWNTLGLIQTSLGQWNEAIACYQQDLGICLQLNDRHGMGLTYGNLGEVYQKQGNWSEARAAYQQALTLIREFANRYDEIEALANLAFLAQEMAEYDSAFDYYNQAIQIIEALRAGISSETAQAGFFATVIDTYAHMVLLCLTTGREAQAFNIVEQARSRAFLDLLAARSSYLSEQMRVTPLTLAEVQAALPADTVLLEYFTTGLVEVREDRPNSQNAKRHRFPPDRTLIFAVTSTEFQVYEAEISPNDLRPNQLNNVVERHFLQPQIRRALYERLIAPVEALLQGKQRLYLIPHGPLHYIPFQALIAPDGDTLLRETGPRLIYAPSATLLCRYGQGGTRPERSACLAIGYNSLDATQLRFAEAEAREVARLTGGQSLVGSSPKITTLYSQAINYRLLHFACHAEFKPESPLTSFLHLAPDERLTASDIFEHLRLQCDLVTLSACESGLSRVRRGDELVGLMRAFLYAGAPALVSSLWRVDDRSTRILMEKFYRQIQTGISFAEALKQAQLYLKNQKIFAEPEYWAAFVLVGGPGS